MNTDEYKIPKSRKLVKLWVHPEGGVSGSIFLLGGSTANSSAEDPLDVMNKPVPFVVLEREGESELRFYNKRSIVRVQYSEPDHGTDPDVTTLRCQLQMMDGSLLEGTIREILKPWASRLYDYINSEGYQFLRIEFEPGDVCLVNKSYVVHIAPLSTDDG